MKQVAIALLLFASICWAQESNNFQPASTNVHLLWIGVGTNEPERMRSGLLKLHTSLEEANIQHVLYESPGTDHEWQTWRRDLKDFAPRLFQ